MFFVVDIVLQIKAKKELNFTLHLAIVKFKPMSYKLHIIMFFLKFMNHNDITVIL